MFQYSPTHSLSLLKSKITCKCIASLTIFLGTLSTSDAALMHFTGEQLLSQPSITYPDGIPSVVDTSIVLGPAKTPRSEQILVQYPLGGNQVNGGLPEAFVSWELTRLPCDDSVGCNNAGGSAGVDHDPIFFISQNNRAYAWQVADNNKGSYFAGALDMSGSVGGPWLDRSTKGQNSNFFPSIGQRYNVDMSFTFFPDHIQSTMNVVIIGRKDIISIPHSFTYFGAFDPSKPFSLGIMNEDNPGERYMLNGASISLAVPEANTEALLLVGLGLAAGVLRRKQSA